MNQDKMEEIAPDEIIEEIIPDQRIEETVPEPKIEQKVPEQKIEEIVPEQKFEEYVPEQNIEEIVPEQNIEEIVPGQNIEEIVPERNIEGFLQYQNIEGNVHDQNIEEETNGTNVEIPMTIESVIKRNCEYMKNWSPCRLTRIFRNNGYLRGFQTWSRSFSEDHPAQGANLVKRTRELAVPALRSILEEKRRASGLYNFRTPTKEEFRRLAKTIISEENIRNKFDPTMIVKVQLRPYDPTEWNNPAVLSISAFPF